MKTIDLFLVVVIAVLTMSFGASKAKAAETIALIPVAVHHVAELNSNQPYVAGYHVNTPDLYTRETVYATAITVSFPSTDPSYFSKGSWLGAGMFVQAQDNKLKHVDYGFYTMLAIDSEGRFYVDLGLHQTRESTAPLQSPTAELIYAYTWQISGIDPATPTTLLARWIPGGFVQYSLSTAASNISVASINVVSQRNCGSIIPQFYAGNYIAGTAFPFNHYVYYFQFGVVSSQVIADTHWSATLKEPKILRNPGWRLGVGWHTVETAWSTQGDISYIDWDWMWGGTRYYGVSAQYHENPLQNPYEVKFFYNGGTVQPGTILWQPEPAEQSRVDDTSKARSNQTSGFQRTRPLTVETATVIAVAAMKTVLRKPRKPRTY